MTVLLQLYGVSPSTSAGTSGKNQLSRKANPHLEGTALNGSRDPQRYTGSGRAGS